MVQPYNKLECHILPERPPQKLIFKRHCMREPGSDGNLNVMFFKTIQIICLMTLVTKGAEGQTLKMTIVHHFTWNLIENMTNRFPHIPDFT